MEGHPPRSASAPLLSRNREHRNARNFVAPPVFDFTTEAPPTPPATAPSVTTPSIPSPPPLRPLAVASVNLATPFSRTRIVPPAKVAPVRDQAESAQATGSSQLVSTALAIKTAYWLHFFKDFPRIVLKVEGSQKYVRSANPKHLVADCQVNKMFDEPAGGNEATAQSRSAGSIVSAWTWKYMFVAEWRHRGTSSTSSADTSGDCVALKASNGMYCSVEQKDGSLTLTSITTPRETELFSPIAVSEGRFALRSVYKTYVGQPDEKGKAGSVLVARRLNSPTPNETFTLALKVGIRLVGSGLLCSCTKAGKFQALGAGTLAKSSCFLLEMGEQGVAVLTSAKRYLTVEMSGSVSAGSRIAGPQEMFTLEPHEDGEYKYYIKTWYGCYLRFSGAGREFIGDKKTRNEATCFQLIPLGVPPEELEQRSVSSQTISAFQGKLADTEELTPEDETKQGKKMLRQLARTNTELSLSRFKEAMAEDKPAVRTASMIMRDTMWPGEVLVLTLEDMAFIVKGTGQLGTVWITNYHIIFNPQHITANMQSASPQTSTRPGRGWRMARGWKISLGHVSFIEEEEAQLDGKYFQFIIHLKDFTIIQLSTLPGSPQPADYATTVVEKLNQLCFPENQQQFLPYLHKQALQARHSRDAESSPTNSRTINSANPYIIYNPQAEFTRIGLLSKNEGAGDGGPWRLSSANSEYALSETYPSHVIVPRVISDEHLRASAEFRSKGRLPAVVWRYPTTGAVLVRCSQPRSGLTGVTCKEDEALVDAIRISTVLPTSTSSSQATSSASLLPNISASLQMSNFSSPLYTPPIVFSSPIHTVQSSAAPPLPPAPPKLEIPQLSPRLSPRSTVAAAASSSSVVASRSITASSAGPQQIRLASNPRTERHLSTRPEPAIQIMDARPLMNALANQLAGAGMEKTNNYRAKRKFLGIENIHVMRNALYRVAKLPLVYWSEGVTSIDFAQWLAQREETAGWLSHVSLLISSAMEILDCMRDGITVIIHCSDGWDRTPQLTSLVQLLADPYYRTIEGFMCLIEKDWLSFGHKFSERIGHGDSNHKDKQRSPIFLQWIESVYQLVLQFPTAFEFGESFLHTILYHAYSCLFGTFLGDCESERVRERIVLTTHSLWTHILNNRAIYAINASSSHQNDQEGEDCPEPLILRPHPKDVVLWMKAHFPLLEQS